jgi:anti-anti-sigma factor
MALRQDDSTPSRVELAALRDDTLVVTLIGEHDLATNARLVEVIAETSEEPNVIVDLTPCTFVDSTTLGVIVRASEQHRARGDRFRVVNSHASRHVRRVIDIARFADIVELHDTLDDALAAD